MVLRLLRRTIGWCVLLGALAAASVACAQSTPERAQRQRLTPQERELVREKLRSRWRAMTAQERDAAKVRLKQRFQSLSPEQKERLRERRRQRRASEPQNGDAN